jgi:hypothetical protein
MAGITTWISRSFVGRQYEAESGHAEQDRRVTVLIEPLTDLLIELCDVGIDGGDLPGELSDELRRDRLSAQNGALGVGRVHGLAGNVGAAAAAALLQPRRQPGRPDSADGVRGLVAG